MKGVGTFAVTQYDAASPGGVARIMTTVQNDLDGEGNYDRSTALRQKRDGRLEHYSKSAITEAMRKAYRAVYPDRDIPEITLALLTDQVERRLDVAIAEGTIGVAAGADRAESDRDGTAAPSIETIQDIVEEVLMASGESEVARSYIIYRARREAVRDTRALMLDIDKTMDGYLSMSDWRVNENANVNFSLGGLILHNSGTITANYWLKISTRPRLPRRIAVRRFISTTSRCSPGYCAGWSLRQLIEEGLGGVSDKITSKPAQHLSTLVQQMVNFWALCRTSGPGRRRFRASIRISRRSCARTSSPTRG